MWWLALACGAELITYTNSHFYDFFLNWHEHYVGLGLSHTLTVYALDNRSHAALTRKGVRTVHWAADLAPADEYTSPAYQRVVHTKPAIIAAHTKNLGLDTTVIWFDCDSVWLRDPVPLLPAYPLSAQMDERQYCTGFVAFTVWPGLPAFLRRWDEAIRGGSGDQAAFNRVADSVPVRGLPERVFPNGKQYKGPAGVAVFHNNWISGHDKKLVNFKRLGLWRLKTRLPA